MPATVTAINVEPYVPSPNPDGLVYSWREVADEYIGLAYRAFLEDMIRAIPLAQLQALWDALVDPVNYSRGTGFPTDPDFTAGREHDIRGFFRAYRHAAPNSHEENVAALGRALRTDIPAASQRDENILDQTRGEEEGEGWWTLRLIEMRRHTTESAYALLLVFLADNPDPVDDANPSIGDDLVYIQVTVEWSEAGLGVRGGKKKGKREIQTRKNGDGSNGKTGKTQLVLKAKSGNAGRTTSKKDGQKVKLHTVLLDGTTQAGVTNHTIEPTPIYLIGPNAFSVTLLPSKCDPSLFNQTKDASCSQLSLIEGLELHTTTLKGGTLPGDVSGKTTPRAPWSISTYSKDPSFLESELVGSSVSEVPGLLSEAHWRTCVHEVAASMVATFQGTFDTGTERGEGKVTENWRHGSAGDGLVV